MLVSDNADNPDNVISPLLFTVNNQYAHIIENVRYINNVFKAALPESYRLQL